MSHLLRDFRHAARGLLATPWFTAGVVLTLALGIGINATMFNTIDALFLRPPAGVRDPQGIARVYFHQNFSSFGWVTQSGTSYPDFVALRDHVTGFSHVAAVANRELALGRGRDASEVAAAAVSPSYFPMLGIKPTLGRLFVDGDNHQGATKVVVLSYAFWQRHFGGDSSVIGRTLPLATGNYQVIGVGPRGFVGIDLSPAEVFVPIVGSIDDVSDPEALGTRDWTWMSVVARRAPGTTPAAAAAQATNAYRASASADPEQAGSKPRLDRIKSTDVVLGPIQEARGPNVTSDAKVSAWIGGVALIVLLIACANVANLLLARGMSRRRELAVRASLGAGRGGLIRSLLAESLLLAALGGVAALIVAQWAGNATRAFLIPDAPIATPENLRLASFIVAAVALTTLCIGAIPAWQSSRTDLAQALRGGDRGSTGRTGRTRATLLAAQLGLTLTLLVGAGLFIKSLRNANAIDLGYDAEHVLAVRVDLSAAGMSTIQANATYLELVNRLAKLGGVSHAAATMGTPFRSAYAVDLRAEGVDSLPRSSGGGPYIQAVTPGYLAALGTRITDGRPFEPSDDAGAAPVAIVGHTFARRVWPGQPALGRCLYLHRSSTCTRVVGVAVDERRGRITDDDPMAYFVPFAQYPDAKIDAIFLRTRGEAATMVNAVRRVIESDGNLPYATVQPLADQVAPQLHAWKLGASAFAAFGLLALLIAAMGTFAVIAYGVSQRTREIGVRLALGAQVADVVRMAVHQGFVPVGAGLLLGIGGALVLSRAVAPLLFGVASLDIAVFASVIVSLTVVALVAAWIPARRASSVDPMIALRAE